MNTTLEQFVKAYIVTALWSSTLDDDTPMDANYGEDDLAPETLAEIKADCDRFRNENAELLATWNTDDDGAHDFWLTRNHHGAGFWDRYFGNHPLVKIGKELTEKAHTFGEYHLYVGDDGKVYGMKG